MIVPAACMFASAASAQNGQLPWSDEFNGTIGPDWVLATGNGAGGWGNKGLQYCRRQNAGIKNNALVINAKCEDFGAYGYTSARMKTQGVLTFKHWKIEARMKLPSFMGTWPALWMLGTNLPQNDLRHLASGLARQSGVGAHVASPELQHSERRAGRSVLE